MTSPGHDWCRNLANALQWPANGSIEDAGPIVDAEGAPPRGCRCFNDAEHQILGDMVPACKVDALLAELEDAARQDCQSLVQPGFDHNCWQANGANASTPEGEIPEDGPGACIGNCEYGAPPSGGSCPDPTPYECETGDGGGGLCETTGFGTGSESADSTGDLDTSGGIMELNADQFISCEEMTCEIDRSFARMIHDDPTLLLGESTRIHHDRVVQRHVFVDVEPGSIAYTRGLRTGDRLESVDGTVIDGLDAALHVYAQSANEDVLDVRVMRGRQWLDFEYVFVP
ncbi:MAG: hypothetical protein KDK70_01600 [Myxococcales bacterium]|nr:hypothetical protein [Myxococcales bacterium]